MNTEQPVMNDKITVITKTGLKAFILSSLISRSSNIKAEPPVCDFYDVTVGNPAIFSGGGNEKPESGRGIKTRGFLSLPHGKFSGLKTIIWPAKNVQQKNE